MGWSQVLGQCANVEEMATKYIKLLQAKLFVHFPVRFVRIGALTHELFIAKRTGETTNMKALLMEASPLFCELSMLFPDLVLLEHFLATRYQYMQLLLKVSVPLLRSMSSDMHPLANYIEKALKLLDVLQDSLAPYDVLNSGDGWVSAWSKYLKAFQTLSPQAKLRPDGDDWNKDDAETELFYFAGAAMFRRMLSEPPPTTTSHTRNLHPICIQSQSAKPKSIGGWW